MNLPPDKVRLLRSYDNEKKWELICDQVGGISKVNEFEICTWFIRYRFPTLKKLLLYYFLYNNKSNFKPAVYGFFHQGVVGLLSFIRDVIILCLFHAGKVSGEEPSTHLHPKTQRLP